MINASISGKSTSHAESELVRQANNLIPALQRNAGQCEYNRQLVDENLELVQSAGLFRMTSPKRYGGLETDLPTQVRVLAALGKGCASTAWVNSVFSVTSWFVGLFDDMAQDEVFEAPDARVAGVLSPHGHLVPVTGGYRLTGRWPFNTGCLHADWDMLAGQVDSDNASQSTLLALVPIRDLEIVRDWNPSGLAGTGSNTVVAEDVFVPLHRTLPVEAASRGEYQSESNRTSTLYKCAFFPFVLANSTGAPLGIARGAMEAFLKRLPGRGITYTGYAVQAEAPVTHLNLAEAAVAIKSAELLSWHAARTVWSTAEERAELSEAQRAALRCEVAQVVRLSRQATQILNSISGASSIQQNIPIQRITRDMQALSLHAMLEINTNLELYGRTIAGLNAGTPFL
ncbi:alkylation response protein AidB-like acyl-CoA dehydrogenase [Streptomyces sp. V4I8]|uniref:acyl-CoA dehydrogenase family protein n=1 Tax=Streptomyces sp. V4I8 TaxID=3156469 RepID=UPI0035192ECD